MQIVKTHKNFFLADDPNTEGSFGRVLLQCQGSCGSMHILAWDRHKNMYVPAAWVCMCTVHTTNSFLKEIRCKSTENCKSRWKFRLSSIAACWFDVRIIRGNRILVEDGSHAEQEPAREKGRTIFFLFFFVSVVAFKSLHYLFAGQTDRQTDNRRGIIKWTKMNQAINFMSLPPFL